MTSVQQAPTAAESESAAHIALPASMQTLLDRYTERTLTVEERMTLAKATPNVRCEALRIFFEMNDAAAAVEYVLQHGSSSSGSNSAFTSSSSPSMPAPSQRRRSGSDGEKNGRAKPSRSATNPASTITVAAAVAEGRDFSSPTAASPSMPRPSGKATALTSLSTNVPMIAHATKEPRADAVAAPKKATKTFSPAADAPAVSLPTPLLEQERVEDHSSSNNNTGGAAQTPMKQKGVRPPSLSAGGAHSGSRPRRASAAYRGESMCTLVTVSSMSDSDADSVGSAGEDNENVSYLHVAQLHDEEEDGAGEDVSEMPPTVTLRSRETRSTPAVPAVPALALDAVLKPAPHDGHSKSKSSDSSSHGEPKFRPASPTVSAPPQSPHVQAEGAEGFGLAPTSAAGMAVPVRDVSPSVLPPPGAKRIEVSAPADAPHEEHFPPHHHKTTTATTIPAAAAEVEVEDEAMRKTVAAKAAPHASFTTDAMTEPTAATTVPQPTPSATAAGAVQRPPTPHHVAFTDAKAMAVLDAYRRHGAPRMGYSEDVELAYTELSCGHSSISPSCAAPSVVSAVPNTAATPHNTTAAAKAKTATVAKSGVDWAALVAAVPAPPAAPTTRNCGSGEKMGRPQLTSPRPDQRGGATPTATAAVAGVRTPRVSATTAPSARRTTTTTITPRTSLEDTAQKRKSGGSGHSTTRKARPNGSAKKKDADTTATTGTTPTATINAQQPATRKKRLSGAEKKEYTRGAATPERKVRIRSADASPVKRGTAWDDTTKTYITHPNQLRRQLSAAAVTAAATAPVYAAGTSALETPDALHYYFGRTASTAVVAVADGGNGEKTHPHTTTTTAAAIATTVSVGGGERRVGSAGKTSPRPPQTLMRTPTSTAATTNAMPVAAFGRLCSSALHLSKDNDLAKTPRGSVGARPMKKAAAPANALTTPRTTSATADKLLKKKRHAAAPPPPPPTSAAAVVATPRSHATPHGHVHVDYARLRSGYAHPTSAETTLVSTNSTGFQRLRSGYPAVHPHDVYREGGEVINLQRQASHYHGQPYPSVEALRRIASGVPAIQPSGHVYCPSTIRSPRTARRPAPQQQPQEDAEDSVVQDTSALRRQQHHHHHQQQQQADSEGWLSAREMAYNRTASHYPPPPSSAAVPSVQCGVFERLTSNYYAVYTSAAALQAPAVVASPRENTIDNPHCSSGNGKAGGSGSGVKSGRRRNASAPAGQAGRRAALRRGGAASGNPYPAMREGWLSPDGKLAATHSSTEAEAAPAGSAFTRSNTSRYLNF